jgi:predicted enzyme related to lactoylglutathione lyase
MPRIVHFEIPAEDPERAVKFYEAVFGWKINRWEGPVDYWLVITGEEGEPGIDGAIMPREGPAGEVNTVNTVEVDSFDAFADKVTAAGGKLVTPKQAIPGVGYHAYCLDTEGNLFGIMQSDPSAK